MKTSKEISTLLFEKQEEFESVVRALHLPMIEFLGWMLETDRNEAQTYWAMGYLNINQSLIPMRDGKEFHRIISEQKQEILSHFSRKFNVTVAKN